MNSFKSPSRVAMVGRPREILPVKKANKLISIEMLKNGAMRCKNAGGTFDLVDETMQAFAIFTMLHADAAE